MAEIKRSEGESEEGRKGGGIGIQTCTQNLSFYALILHPIMFKN